MMKLMKFQRERTLIEVHTSVYKKAYFFYFLFFLAGAKRFYFMDDSSLNVLNRFFGYMVEGLPTKFSLCSLVS